MTQKALRFLAYVCISYDIIVQHCNIIHDPMTIELCYDIICIISYPYDIMHMIS